MRVAFTLTFCLLLLMSGRAVADRQAGIDVFRENCVGCHSIECNRDGPKLVGLIGRPAGTVADYNGYSDAMKNSGIVWNENTLDAFLADPASYIPKNAMASFGRVDDQTGRQDLIEFLVEPDTSLDLCF